MVLRQKALQADLMRWDDSRGRYVLTGTGRRQISARNHVSHSRHGTEETIEPHTVPARVITLAYDRNEIRQANVPTPTQARQAMKSLYLLRHAKSSWKAPALNDHDRPLSKRGRQAAKIMAKYLRRSKIAPDLVICSKALLLIGHNPALHDLALELVRTDKPPPAFEKFPMGAMAGFHLDGAWKALEAHGAVLTSLVTPKSIAGVNVHTCERNS